MIFPRTRFLRHLQLVANLAAIWQKRYKGYFKFHNQVSQGCKGNLILSPLSVGALSVSYCGILPIATRLTTKIYLKSPLCNDFNSIVDMYGYFRQTLHSQDCSLSLTTAHVKYSSEHLERQMHLVAIPG